MPGRYRKPWAATRLKGEPSEVCRAKKAGAHLVEAVEGQIAPLDASGGIGAVDDLITADAWYRRIADLLRGVGVLRASDEAALMMMAHALERYQRVHMLYSSMGPDDLEAAAARHQALHKEVALITRLSDRLGLNPAARSRFIVQAAAGNLMSAQAAKVGRSFNWDA